MRILHINSYFSDRGKPTFYKNLFETQVEQGLDISVYVPLGQPVNFAAQKKFGEYSILAKTHNSRDRWIFRIKQGKILTDAKDRFPKGRFDLIHSHSLFTNGYVAWKLGEVLGIPFVTAIRDTDINYFFRFMPHVRKTGLDILSNAGKVFSINKPYLETLAGRYLPDALRNSLVAKAKVVCNGIDKFWLKNRLKNGKRLELESKNLALLTVGKIINRKNQLTAAKAAEILNQRGFKVTLTVVGEEKDKKILRKLQSFPFVRYLPPVAKESLIDIYREADIFVLPSITETFGLVYPEAMSQGLPLVYSRGQGFDGQFEEGKVGFHAACRDAEEIADRIVDITMNYEEISRNCVDLCTRFNWADIAREYRTIYEECLEARKVK